MSTVRDWKTFNDEWRDSDLARRFWRWLGRALRVLSYPLRHPHRTVKAIEPWGILFAVIGLSLSLLAFALDYQDKVEERTVRAWQLLTTRAPGNSGKIEALRYLNRRDGFWCDDERCLITLKERSPLNGIDLSTEDGQAGAYLAFADLRRASLAGADLRGVNLEWARLRQADLFAVDLRGAFLSKADLSGVDLSEADLGGASLSLVDLRGANLMWTKGLSQGQLDGACGDEATRLNDGLTIPHCAKFIWFERIHVTDRKAARPLSCCLK